MPKNKQAVLLVIPESRERSQLSLLMRELEHPVNVCPDPFEAIQELGRQEYLLAIVDQEQPGFSSFELVRQMRKVGSSCHIVLLATEDKTKSIGSPAKHGISEIIYRPIQPRRLLGRLETVLKKPLPPIASMSKVVKSKESTKKSVDKIPAKPIQKGLTQSPFQSVSSNNYQPSFMVSQSGASRDLLAKLWQVRMFDHTVVLTGEQGSEFELIARELNTLGGCGQQFPLLLKPDDLKDKDYLSTIQAQADLRGGQGPMVIVEDATSLHPKHLAILYDFLKENESSQKRHLRFVICVTGFEDDYEADAWAWLQKVKVLAEAVLEIAPLRDRKEDIKPYARKLFYDITNVHSFLTVRNMEPATLDCLEDFVWPGNYLHLVAVMRSAMANCPGSDLTLHLVQPHLVQENIARYLMESVADEKLLYPNFAAANG